MKSFDLFGVDTQSKPVKLGKDVATFTDKDSKFCVSIIDAGTIQLITTKGTYFLSKHPSLNYFNATINDHKVQVHLKATSGWLKFW